MSPFSLPRTQRHILAPQSHMSGAKCPPTLSARKEAVCLLSKATDTAASECAPSFLTGNVAASSQSLAQQYYKRHN